jgi:hypothetical protein
MFWLDEVKLICLVVTVVLFGLKDKVEQLYVLQPT